MPSQIRTSAATTAADEKPKITPLFATSLRLGLLRHRQRVGGQQLQERIVGTLFDALGERQQPLLELRDTCAPPRAPRCGG